MKVLVTGGAGYIGSHTAQALLKAGHQVFILDNITTGFREAIPAGIEFIQGDVRSSSTLAEVINKYPDLPLRVSPPHIGLSLSKQLVFPSL